MNLDVNYISQAVRDQKLIIKKLEEQRIASICPIVQETLDRRLEKEGADLEGWQELLVDMRQP